MSQKIYKEKLVRFSCSNCKNTVIGVCDSAGAGKVCCPKCGTKTIFRLMGRRHINFDVYAPQGQEFIDDDDE